MSFFFVAMVVPFQVGDVHILAASWLSPHRGAPAGETPRYRPVGRFRTTASGRSAPGRPLLYHTEPSGCAMSQSMITGALWSTWVDAGIIEERRPSDSHPISSRKTRGRLPDSLEPTIATRP